MKELVSSLRRIGLLLLLGFLLVCCLALGVVYLQQTVRQNNLKEELDKLSLTVGQPAPSAEKLKAEYQEVMNSIPLPEPEAIIAKIVEIAKKSGIDVDPEDDKFDIPAQNSMRDEKIGDAIYQIITFRDIRAQGDYDSVVDFISRLESGENLKTAVVKAVNLSESKIKGEEVPEHTALVTVDVYTKRKG